MSDILRLNRVQIQRFIGDDPDAVQNMEQLLRSVSALLSEVELLKTQVADLDARVVVLEAGP